MPHVTQRGAGLPDIAVPVETPIGLRWDSDEDPMKTPIRRARSVVRVRCSGYANNGRTTGEQRANTVRTPYEQRANTVRTTGEQRANTVRTRTRTRTRTTERARLNTQRT